MRAELKILESDDNLHKFIIIVLTEMSIDTSNNGF